MRPLLHPSINDITVECILHALSDPIRVHIFAEIAETECPQTCSAFLEVSNRVVPKSTLSQHFRVLREAGLIRSERRGVEMLNYSRIADINRRFPGLIRAIIDSHKIQVEQERASRQASIPA